MPYVSGSEVDFDSKSLGNLELRRRECISALYMMQPPAVAAILETFWRWKLAVNSETVEESS